MYLHILYLYFRFLDFSSKHITALANLLSSHTSNVYHRILAEEHYAKYAELERDLKGIPSDEWFVDEDAPKDK